MLFFIFFCSHVFQVYLCFCFIISWTKYVFWKIIVYLWLCIYDWCIIYVCKLEENDWSKCDNNSNVHKVAKNCLIFMNISKYDLSHKNPNLLYIKRLISKKMFKVVTAKRNQQCIIFVYTSRFILVSLIFVL